LTNGARIGTKKNSTERRVGIAHYRHVEENLAESVPRRLQAIIDVQGFAY
jgi:hypothetical protein